MADLLERRHVTELIEFREPPCVSIYLPTHPITPESDQDRIRLKNLLDEAERQVLVTGVRAPVARELLAPARELLEQGEFWSYQSDGLALFLAPNWSRTYRLPVAFAELVLVGERFHVKPLIPLLAADGRFYVLALSQNEVRLLQGSRQRVELVQLNEVPQSLAEVLKYDELEGSKQVYIAARGGHGAAAVFHGHGGGKEVDRIQQERFVRAVDAGLHEIFRSDRAPLVLAGVTYLQAMFRQQTRYPFVLGEGVDGNPEELRPDELHARAWTLVQPVFAEAVQTASDRYLAAAGQGAGAVAAVDDVVRAAVEGRVDTLFVPAGDQVWGAVDAGTHEVVLHDERRPGDEDLLDLAAVQTLSQSGTVFAVPAEDVPGTGPAAALLRY